jgi:hypothetical protein
MKTPHNPSAVTPTSRTITALVQDLDDATFRARHALLNEDRARDFSHWLDGQLRDLEHLFRDYLTPHSVRRSLGR